MRDRQIADLQDMCESKQTQIAQLTGLGHGGHLGDSGVSADCGAAAGMAAEVEWLRNEKSELERLLLAKDRQLDALRAVDPSLGESPALQLGAQAIQMFHDTVRLKAGEAGYADEIRQLREEVERLQARIDELEAANAEKR